MSQLFGLGNPLLDISVNAADDLFSKYNLKPADAILAAEEHVSLYTEIQAAPFVPEYVAGGSAQNSLRVAQWMLQEEGATAFTGCVGNDETAEILARCCSAGGVKPSYAVSSTHRTGRCAVLIKDNDRSMCTDLQAASTFTVADLEKSKDVWTQSKAYLVEGYFLTVSVDSVLTLAKHAMENDKLFAFSLSAPFICQFFTEQVKQVLAYTNLVFCNETEAEIIAQAMGWDCGQNYNAIAQKLSEFPFAEGVTAKRSIVITCGAKESVIFDGEVKTLPVPFVPKEEIVDTNGAGDSYSGAYVAALLKGKCAQKAHEAGCFAAQTIIRVSGTQLPANKPAFDF